MKTQYSLKELEELVPHFEGLYNWWRRSRKSIRSFVKENAAALREALPYKG